jgi:hypothetical protein
MNRDHHTSTTLNEFTFHSTSKSGAQRHLADSPRPQGDYRISNSTEKRCGIRECMVKRYWMLKTDTTVRSARVLGLH